MIEPALSAAGWMNGRTDGRTQRLTKKMLVTECDEIGYSGRLAERDGAGRVVWRQECWRGTGMNFVKKREENVVDQVRVAK